MSLTVFLAKLGLLFPAALFATTICWAAQRPDSHAPSKRPDIVRLEQSEFISDYLGIQFSIPSGWMTTDLGDGQAEPHIVDGRKVYLLLRIVPTDSSGGRAQIVLRVVDVLHKEFDTEDLFRVDESLSGLQPIKHPEIEEIVHVENPHFFCGHYELPPSSGLRVYRTKCLVPGGGRRFLPVLTVDSDDPIPKGTLEELTDSWELTLSPSSQEEQEVYKWVDSNFPAVLEEYLPLRLKEFGIAHRTNRDLHTSELEYSFVLRRELWSPRTHAVVRQADSLSVYNQMFFHRMENPTITLEQLRPRIRIKEWTISDSECPAVRSAVDKFWRTKLPRGREDVMIIHPMIYEFNVQSNTMDAKVTITDDEHPWARWATKTRAQLQTCIAGPHR